MYQKNLASYEHKTSTKSLRTRITFITTIRGEGEKPVDKHYKVVVDSPLINKYSQIYEDVVEVNDQDVVDEATLLKYGKQYFRTTLCDMLEDSIEIDVIGQSDVPVQMYDVVSVYHEQFDLDVRKKITKYSYSPMAKKLKSIGFGDFKSGLANAIGNAVSDAVKNETQHLQGQFATQLAKEIKNADLDFDRKVQGIKNEITDGLNAAKAKAEEVKRQLSDTIDQRFSNFNNGPLQEAKRRAEEALRNAGASSLLAQEAKQISEQVRRQLDSKADLVEFQRVKETNQLYERIIGRSESDIAEKVARMTLTNQLFQVEVAKNTGDNRNYVRNADFRDGSKKWKESDIAGLNFNYEHSSQNRNKSGVHIYGTSINARYFGLQQTFKIELKKSDKITLSFLVSKDGYNTFSGLNVGLHYRKDGAIKSQSWKEIPNGDITSSIYKKLNFNYELPVDVDEINLMLYGQQGKSINLYISEIKLETGNNATSFTLAPEDTDEAVRTVQNQLAGSWAIQNLTSAGSIVSQINATNNQILIEAEKIRLKGKTLLDELTAIQGYFKRLFVGEGTFAKLNAEIIGSRTITADKLIMDQAMARMFGSSDIFTDTLAAKEAFINKIRSVVVSATLLEGYKGRIGGFQIGTHEKGPSVYWLTGQNQFAVGMSNGGGKWNQVALWVSWGSDWNKVGPLAWYVKHDGTMHCKNTAHFRFAEVTERLTVDGELVYRTNNGLGFYNYSPIYQRIDRSNNYLYLYYNGTKNYDWIPMNREISDRRYKSNIEHSTISGLDVIEKLKTYSYRKEYDGEIEDISCGIMAQDVQKYAPEAFYENPDGAYSYRTFELVPYLIKAIQELNQKIQKLEKTA